MVHGEDLINQGGPSRDGFTFVAKGFITNTWLFTSHGEFNYLCPTSQKKSLKQGVVMVVGCGNLIFHWNELF